MYTRTLWHIPITLKNMNLYFEFNICSFRRMTLKYEFYFLKWTRLTKGIRRLDCEVINYKVSLRVYKLATNFISSKIECHFFSSVIWILDRVHGLIFPVKVYILPSRTLSRIHTTNMYYYYCRAIYLVKSTVIGVEWGKDRKLCDENYHTCMI
jgi:hypothetical protein